MDISTYYLNNHTAKEALTKLANSSSNTDWLSKYKSLYLELTYGEEGLPRLTDCNFEGQYFENIDKFCATYVAISLSYASDI